ncbi:transposase [Burkholderia cenocepacia]|uniref:transposase n=1 Tax=Burkholderia cenocepacia TaxID=95486 RepID=UPI0035D60D0A
MGKPVTHAVKTVSAPRLQTKALRCRSSSCRRRKGFVLLPRHWVVRRSFGWASRFRRLARDDERLPDTLVGLYFVIFTVLMLVHFVDLGRSRLLPSAESAGAADRPQYK